MRNFSMKIPDLEFEALERASEKQERGKSSIVRDALRAYLSKSNEIILRSEIHELVKLEVAKLLKEK